MARRRVADGTAHGRRHRLPLRCRHLHESSRPNLIRLAMFDSIPTPRTAVDHHRRLHPCQRAPFVARIRSPPWVSWTPAPNHPDGHRLSFAVGGLTLIICYRVLPGPRTADPQGLPTGMTRHRPTGSLPLKTDPPLHPCRPGDHPPAHGAPFPAPAAARMGGPKGGRVKSLILPS